MKKLCMIFLVMLFVPSLVFSADFVPVAKLDIEVNDFVQYDFDGKPVDIPVNVLGASARAYLVIETTGLAGVLPRIQNGFVGWHTMSKIDTSVYISTGDDFAKGPKVITWSGLDNDGNPVAEGTYTYHVFAYDFEGTMQPAIQLVDYDRCAAQGRMLLQTYDENKVPYPKPTISSVSRSSDIPRIADLDPRLLNVWCRTSLGNDPFNAELTETCEISLPETWNLRTGAFGRSPYDPADFNYIYHYTSDHDASMHELRKFKLVLNDVAEEITDWGEDLTWVYEFAQPHNGGIDIVEDTYLSVPNWYTDPPNPYLFLVDLDGNKVEDIYLKEMVYYGVDDEGNVTATSGGPQGGMAFKNDTLLALGGMGRTQMVANPVQYLESGEYDDLFVATFDNRYWPDDPLAIQARNYSFWGCESGFSLCSNQRFGPYSFSIHAPDMTFIALPAIAGETDFGQACLLVVDSDTPYDGLYLRPAYFLRAEREEIFAGIGMMYIGCGSDKGTIGKVDPAVSVATGPFAEDVLDPNYPNPGNPTTTISFTISEAGNVTLDVFNVAGQKVDTLVNDFMDAGKHSVVWDGSSFAAGIYFYTMTSGEFTKTMKMTLLK